MIDYGLLLKEFSKIEICKNLECEELKALDYKFFKESIVWEIETEITFNHKNVDVKLYLNFPNDFPFVTPKIFISKESYHNLKYIPHINEDLSICVFDEGLNLILPKTNFVVFIELIVSKAKKLIRDAEDIDYRKKEFKKEFKAYWELAYSKNDVILNLGFHTINNSSDEEIKGIKFTNNYLSNYEYFISNNANDLKKIKEYAKEYKCNFKEIGILIIENNFIEPPFELTFTETLTIIKKDNINYNKFKDLCRSNDFDSVLVIFTNNSNSSNEYYGWTYKNLEILSRKKGGLRKINSKIDHLSNLINKKKYATRITFDNLSLDRLQLRTTGYIESKKSLVISGLGSIGSNLIFYLKNLPINKFNLIDKEILSSENINRHLSGFSFLKNNKVDAIKYELKNSNPLIEVEVRKKSVTTIIQNEVNFINDCDFHIVAVGKTMIEEFILKASIEEKLTRPLFIFWVEPFLASGQMLFIMPNDAQRALALIKNENYPYSVLSNSEKQHDKTYLIEGSCQTGYFPYSASYLIQFLSTIFPYIKGHIVNNDNVSKVYSWIGNKELLNSKGLVITDFANDNNLYDLVINDL
ncbi:ThiF family adenylyltransferase [Mariniflexile aquimaris]|uniref:ThiF family adenylyltransferase n=1 Tax=Mariniflexile aquimaris TaxID=881009 RepID=A0ABW3BUM7_9FLAO